MSDLNSTDSTISADKIEALLAQFHNLINSERTIVEITQEANTLTEQIEQYIKASNIAEKSVDQEVQISSEVNDAPSNAVDTDQIKDTEDKKTEHIEDSGTQTQNALSVVEQWDKLSRNFRKKRRKYYEERNKDLQENLKKRMALIESFRGLLTVEEDISNTLKTFKSLQQEWFDCGPIPKSDYDMVWQTYRHHVENFYDYLDLNREFRDLDFKYNYDQKLRIIAQAQKLAALEDQNLAFKELQKLHKIWKEDIGPVAKEHREPLWQTFSEVTKIIHDKRQEFYQNRDEKQLENLARKKAIIQEIQAITTQNDPNHKSWQKSVKHVQKLRDEFFDLGPVPKKENKALWSEFKQANSDYNQIKNAFFKDQKKELMANLKAKKELIELAEKHLESEDFEQSTPLMKKIQADWRNIGPVPHRDSDKIWKRFKTACNAYFQKLQSEQKLESESEQNALAKKKEILKTLTKKNTGNFKELDELKLAVNHWHETGKIPAKHTGLENEFFDCITMHLIELGQSEHEAALTSFNLKIEGFVAQGQDQLLQQQGQLVDQKIKELKTEINQLENNLGFFQNVAQDNPLLKEVHKNITGHRNDLALWQEKKQVLKRL